MPPKDAPVRKMRPTRSAFIDRPLDMSAFKPLDSPPRKASSFDRDGNAEMLEDDDDEDPPSQRDRAERRGQRGKRAYSPPSSQRNVRRTRTNGPPDSPIVELVSAIRSRDEMRRERDYRDRESNKRKGSPSDAESDSDRDANKIRPKSGQTKPKAARFSSLQRSPSDTRNWDVGDNRRKPAPTYKKKQPAFKAVQSENESGKTKNFARKSALTKPTNGAYEFSSVETPVERPKSTVLKKPEVVMEKRPAEIRRKEPLKPVRSANPVNKPFVPVKPVSPVERLGSAKTAAPIKAFKSVKAIEPVKPAEPVKARGSAFQLPQGLEIKEKKEPIKARAAGFVMPTTFSSSQTRASSSPSPEPASQRPKPKGPAFVVPSKGSKELDKLFENPSTLSSAFREASPPFSSQSSTNERVILYSLDTCPKCSQPCPTSIIKDLVPAGARDIKLAIRNKICIAHLAATDAAEWKRQGWPDIKWKRMAKRVSEKSEGIMEDLEKILRGIKKSPFRAEFEKGAKKTNAKTTDVLREGKMEKCGYYGNRGTNIFIHTLMERFGDLASELAVTDEAIARTSAVAFVQNVLVPELAIRLIMEDMRLRTWDEGKRVFDESAEIGWRRYEWDVKEDIERSR